MSTEDRRQPVTATALQNARMRQEARNPPPAQELSSKPRGKTVVASWWRNPFASIKSDHVFLFIALLLIVYVVRTNFRDEFPDIEMPDVQNMRRAVVAELSARISGTPSEDQKQYV